ncbi:MAG TPA: sensor histidine kinase [Ruminococcaceae bacterium]|nr:sensor histidine kinase [Oscillospiraceae bacterium]
MGCGIYIWGANTMKIKGILFTVLVIFTLQIVICLGLSYHTEIPKVDKVLVNEIIHEQGLGAALEMLERTPENFQEVRQMMMFTLLISMALEILLLVGYLIYLQKTIFQPFRTLKEFAVRVAGGNLDVPFTMDKRNAFGAFTESFDLMRDALKASREQEAEANRSKKELIAKLSHDIKTPVSSISAVTELMQATHTDKKILSQLSIIHNKADQINRLVSDLFNATLEVLHQLPVAPTEQSSESLLPLFVAADYKNKAAINDMPSCLLIYDTQRLQQVLDNIFSNAYKYGGQEIEVICTLFENHFTIEVYNESSAVSDEDLPLLCEKFYRGENANGKNGAGLGLYISRYLLGEMGGDITCRNTERGFCVSIMLSLAGNFTN